MTSIKSKTFVFALIWLSFFCILLPTAHPEENSPDSTQPGETLTEEEKQLFQMDLQQLMQTEVVVTSVSKRPQKLHETASAIYVVTQEDIRRTGAVNIMEALRIVPGVQVSKINQNRYAISIRGFNRRLGSDKLLVLMDGRTLYSPSAAGVFWIGQDTMLEDIDRIEVIRGPGAALWGSNAVAGVINIITKSAHDTDGLLVSGGTGTEEKGFGSVRYAGEYKEGLNYRVYARYRDRDEGLRPNGNTGIDDKQMYIGGFRTDWQANPENHLTFQGDHYSLDAGLDFNSRFVSLSQGNAPFQGTTTQRGSNFLARWDRYLEDASAFKVQAYYDRLLRKADGVPFDNVVEQADLEFQYDFLTEFWSKTHNVSWGLNYRYTRFNFDHTEILELPDRDTNLFGFFIHDEISLVPDTWSLITGIKIEHNEFSGFEFQPSIRTVWTPNNRHTLWSAVSRAVRIPTVTEATAEVNRALIPGAPPLLLRERNQNNLDAEELIAYEVGYRFKPIKELNFDATAYYFDYDKIIEFTTGPVFFEATPPPPHLVFPFKSDNSLKGEVFGFELAAQWQPLSNWRIAGSYTFTKIDLKPLLANVFNPGAFNSEGDLDAEGEPEHIFNIRSYLNLPHNFEFDSFLYYVSRNSTRRIPAYTRVDLRLGWKPVDDLELSLVAQNLQDNAHPELTELLEASTETQRSFYFKVTMNFD